MKRFVTILFLLLSQTLFAASGNTLANQINTLMAKRLPNANVGIAITDAKTGKVLYQHNGYQAFSPASNVKLMTAAAALFYLGPDFQYHTKMLLNKKRFAHHTVEGNVAFVFSGDPTFTIKDLKAFITTLKNKGVERIRGNIILDGTRFAKPNYTPGTLYGDHYWSFAAPISAFMVNQNALYFQIVPSRTLGKHAKVLTTKNGRAYAKLLKSKVTTVSYINSLNHCQLLINVNNKNTFHFGGCWPITGHAKGLKLAIRNPQLFVEKIIQKSLNQNHIRWHGHFVVKKAPKNLDVIDEYTSPELKRLLITMMKDSNNIYAESLTKTLGFEKYGKGSFQLGSTAIKAIVAKKTGIDFNNARLRGGAGASRYNLITPMQFTRLLYVINHSALRQTFIDTLPDSGANGTLSRRMTSFDIKNAVVAKTGSMQGISALSGYVTTQKGQPLIFSILINHIVTGLNPARQFQDQLLVILRKMG